MKSKLLIMGVLCAVAFTANAQTEKGKNFINGSVGFSSSDKDFGTINGNSALSNYATKTKNFNIMPNFGHFVSNNLAIGLGIGYQNIKTTNISSDFTISSINYSSQISKQNSINFAPFIRYYINVVEKFKFFGQFNPSIGFGKGEYLNSQSYSSGSQIINNSSESDYKFTTYGAAINPGFAFFPSKRWAIEFSFPLISYAKIKPKDQGTNSVVLGTSEDFNFATSSFNPSIGFNFHF